MDDKTTCIYIAREIVDLISGSVEDDASTVHGAEQLRDRLRGFMGL